MPKGGYRQPMNPAPVSGPGSLSQRTDGGATEGMTQPTQRYTGMPYGKNKEVNDAQGQASLAGNPFPMADLVPLDAPTARRDEPITTGINMGAGAGTEAMRGMPNRAPSLIDTIKHLTQFDPSGDSELIYRTLTDSGY
jgi:hypothetical protein